MNINRILLLVNFIVAGLVLWMSFNIYESWSGHKQGGEALSVQKKERAIPQDASSIRRKTFTEYQGVVDQDIFHTSKDNTSEPLEQAKDIEITQLNIKLKGVLLRAAEASFAVIYDEKSKTEEIYYLNDYVQGARVVQIFPDRIVLSRGGKQEALMLTPESPPESRRKGAIKRKRPVRRRVKPGR